MTQTRVKPPHTLQDLVFDNRFVHALPADPEQRNYTRPVLGACYSKVTPTPVANPALIAHSAEVLQLLGLPENSHQTQEFADVFSGNLVLEQSSPYAACYGGHQFGNWAGQLGDGRAISLGELLAPDHRHWELQLKGAGPTPYSRRADGRAVMRSSVREFLCSEAMVHLGVPTTRALSLVSTGEQVLRDMFYDGNVRPEPGAIVCRVAPSFLRFGNFELLAEREEHELLKMLADYTLKTHFPHLGEPSKEVYLQWLKEICRSTATMISHWMRVGFVHGVMNTDNMSILGLTIDYGPYGWLEGFDPDWTPNTTDASGRRYRFGNQPRIGFWNLVQLANALYPLVKDVEALEETLNTYPETLDQLQPKMMAEKIGLKDFSLKNGPSDDAVKADITLIQELMEILQLAETDMTLFHRLLSNLKTTPAHTQNATQEQWLAPMMDAYYNPEELTPELKQKTCDWLKRYAQRLVSHGSVDEERKQQMDAVNPKYVMRNYLAQLAIDKAEEGDGSVVMELLEVMRHPYDEQPGREEYAKKRPEWARHRPGCSMLSCSS